MNKQTLSSEIPKTQLIYGLLIGISVAFICYSSFYLYREVFRYISITDDSDLWILSDKAVSFYNLIFGFMAVIFGQSAFFLFIFNRPKKIPERKHYLKISIVNDQRFLNVYFLYWFLNISLLFAIFSGNVVQGGFHVLNFYPEYNYVFILIVIVLFLQTWTSIRRKYKQRSIKWFIISVSFLTLSAFGLSRINLIDYKAINEICLQKNIIHSYQINLPESIWAENWRSKNNEKRIFIVTENSKLFFIIDNRKVETNQLSEIILDWIKSNSEPAILLTCKLYSSKDQKMSVINKLKAKLSKCGIRRITYAVSPVQIKYDKKYYRDEVIESFIPYVSEENIIDYYNKAHLFSNIIEIECRNEKLILNKESLSAETFKSQMKKSIFENSDYTFKHIINDNNSYAEYIKVHSLLRKVIGELREEYLFFEYGRKPDNVFDEKAMKKYPIHLIEITEELNNLMAQTNKD